MEYQQIYTDLRIAKMSFSDFMAFLGTIYDLGVENGKRSAATEEYPAYFAAVPLGEQFEYRSIQ